MGRLALVNGAVDGVVVAAVQHGARPRARWTRAPRQEAVVQPAWCRARRHPGTVVPRDVVLAVLVVTRPAVLGVGLAARGACVLEGRAAGTSACSRQQLAAADGAREVGAAAQVHVVQGLGDAAAFPRLPP